MMNWIAIICSGFVALSLCLAQDTVTVDDVANAMPAQVSVLVEFISTDTQTAFALVANDHKEPAREALSLMLTDGSAKVEEIAYLITRSGSQAQVESIVEMIYATEYQSPKLVQMLEGPIIATNQIRTPAAPTAYQTRNLGVTLKVTPQVGPGRKSVEVDLVVEQTEHAGDDTNGQWEATITWPRFHSKQITNNLIIANGKAALVGMLAPKTATSPRRILAFVQTKILPVTTIEKSMALRFPNKTLTAKKRPPQQQTEGDDPFAGFDDSERPFAGTPERNDAIVTLLLEAIEVPESAIFELLKLRKIADATAMREALEPLIKNGRATVKEALHVSAKSAEKGTVRSGNERIYAVEMSGPELTPSVEGEIDSRMRLAIPTVYSSHETRSDGFEFEFDAQIGPYNHTIDLSAAISETKLLGQVTYGQGLSQATMPLFSSQRLATNATILSGDHSLLSITSSRAKDGANLHRYTLTFVRAVVQ